VSAQPSAGSWSGRRVTVTGGAGFLGRAVTRLLGDLGAQVKVVRSIEHDLRDPRACRDALRGSETVLHLAARVGGIGFLRRNPGPAAHDNLLMAANVFEACRELEVRKLVAACSVCAYPAATPVPFREDHIWEGYPEPSTAPYGYAKRSLLVLSDAYRRQYGLDSSVPVMTNVYGPRDNFDLEDSHVIAALVRKYVEAAEDETDQVVVWGSGNATREFLYVDDAARALLLAAEAYDSSEPVNIGTGEEVPIRDLAGRIATLTGFQGTTTWDTSRPDGEMRRFLDVSRARKRLGFRAEMSLEEGLRRTIESFREAAALRSGGGRGTLTKAE
jgi:GDP-L-fucose synthase